MEYNIAWQKWTKGTGGGSGDSEHFKDWETRNDTEKFANYAEYGSVDYLAYIYMLDKSKNFPLNAIHDPAPKDTVMEDGTSNVGKDGKTRRRKTASDRAKESVKEMTEGLNDIMTNAVKLLTSTMTAGTNEPGDNAVATAFRSVDGMNRTLNLMQSLKMQIDMVKNTISEDDNDSLQAKQVKKGALSNLNKPTPRLLRRLVNLNKKCDGKVDTCKRRREAIKAIK